MRSRRSALAAALSVAATGAVLTGIPQAQAATSQPPPPPSTAGTPPASWWSSGVCRTGDACLYYNSGQQGSYVGVRGTVNHTTGMKFGGGNGSGRGTALKNNAASVHNMNWYYTLRVFYNSGFSCQYACQDFQERMKGNLNSQLKNNNASQSWR